MLQSMDLNSAVIGLGTLLVIGFLAFVWAYYRLRHVQDRHGEQIQMMSDSLSHEHSELRDTLHEIKSSPDPLSDLMRKSR
jgi:hypothetical protein